MGARDQQRISTHFLISCKRPQENVIKMRPLSMKAMILCYEMDQIVIILHFM